MSLRLPLFDLRSMSDAESRCFLPVLRFEEDDLVERLSLSLSRSALGGLRDLCTLVVELDLYVEERCLSRELVVDLRSRSWS